jgi:hypothetical protein
MKIAAFRIGFHLGLFTICALASAEATFAQGQPSAKVTAQVSSVAVIPSTNTWHTLYANDIHTANMKDLLIDVSIVSSLITRTLTKSKNGATDTESAAAGVEVRVLVDGQEAAPGPVAFEKRKQTLSAKLQGIIDGAIVVDENGTPIIDPDLVTDEEIELILETTSANSFGFIRPDVPSGMRHVEVQVRIDTNISSADASASAIVGAGSMVVEAVRMIKDEDIILDGPAAQP